MDYKNDNRIVLTLDVGGTNLVFSAIQGMKEVVEPVRIPTEAKDLDKSLDILMSGFTQVIEKLDDKPVAISFAFPGPADYPNGIIGTPPNMPAFHNVALGPFLESKFGIPVFLNNDGDLFVYGEAMAGFLPKVNQMLEDAGSPKRFNKLFGITLGTGFGGGLVADGKLYIGDNSCAGEIWITRNKRHPKCFAEEGVAIRAVKGTYARITGMDFDDTPEPKDIFAIAQGKQDGNVEAAKAAFAEMGEVIGDALSNAITLLDGIIVIGGGLSKAYPEYIGAILAEMNGTIESYSGDKLPRIPMKTYDLENDKECQEFIKGEVKDIVVPGTDTVVKYDSQKRIGVGMAVLDTSYAISVGAYAFALNQLDS